jgi:parallel beta-helix repeat protein
MSGENLGHHKELWRSILLIAFLLVGSHLSLIFASSGSYYPKETEILHFQTTTFQGLNATIEQNFGKIYQMNNNTPPPSFFVTGNIGYAFFATLPFSSSLNIFNMTLCIHCEPTSEVHTIFGYFDQSGNAYYYLNTSAPLAPGNTTNEITYTGLNMQIQQGQRLLVAVSVGTNSSSSTFYFGDSDHDSWIQYNETTNVVGPPPPPPPPVEGTIGVVYIRADGSVDPPSVPLLKQGYSYILTQNLSCCGVVIEKDNVILDGSGHWLQGNSSGSGITVSDRINVTIRDIQLTMFSLGLNLSGSVDCVVTDNNISSITNGTVSFDSGAVSVVNCSRVTMENLNISNVGEGITVVNTTGTMINNDFINFTRSWSIQLSNSSFTTISNSSLVSAYYSISVLVQNSNWADITNNCISRTGVYSIDLETSSFNQISGNNITHTDYDAILLDNYSNNNTVSENNIEDSWGGIHVYASSFNTIFGNTIDNSQPANLDGVCIYFEAASNNLAYHNNILKSTYPWAGDTGSNNKWDNGYPCGGNYWSGYLGFDVKSGPYQNETGSDGIGDTPYTVYGSSVDHYPLIHPYTVPEFPSIVIIPLMALPMMFAIIAHKKLLKSNSGATKT